MGLVSARLAIVEDLDHLEKVPVQLGRRHVFKQLLDAGILDENLEGSEKLFVRRNRVQAVRCEQVVEVVAAHIDQHLADPHRQKVALLDVRVCCVGLLVEHGPAVLLVVVG